MSDAPGEPEIHPLIRVYGWLVVVGLPAIPAVIALRGAGGSLSVDNISLQLIGVYAGWAAPIGLAVVLIALACLAAAGGAGPVRMACLGPLCLLGYSIALALLGTFVFAPGGFAGTRLGLRIYFWVRNAGVNAVVILATGLAYLLPLAPWKRLRSQKPGMTAALAFFLLWGYAVASFFKLLLRGS
ncbi:MAG: hypothetical protein ACYTGB_13920 [Planctomycetota bacterium]